MLEQQPPWSPPRRPGTHLDILDVTLDATLDVISTSSMSLRRPRRHLTFPSTPPSPPTSLSEYDMLGVSLNLSLSEHRLVRLD